MPSPFPGMDPWLEDPAIFPDFHAGYINALRAQLNMILPPPFFAAISTRVYMEASDRSVEPDVDVFKPVGEDAASHESSELPLQHSTALLEIPVRPYSSEEFMELYLEVRTTTDDHQLITSIEVLNPSNKSSDRDGRVLYLAKQHELRRSGVHLIEIDLLRAGLHATAANSTELRRRTQYDYHVALTHADRPDATLVSPVLLSDRMPVIPVPLTVGVPDIQVDLQVPMDRVYDEGAYRRRLNYGRPPVPPLTAEQQAWAEELLRAKGLLPRI